MASVQQPKQRATSPRYRRPAGAAPGGVASGAPGSFASSTGLGASAADERAPHRNRAIARKRLRWRIAHAVRRPERIPEPVWDQLGAENRAAVARAIALAPDRAMARV